MRGLMAYVTSVIGGKDEKYAIRVQPVQQDMYFVYKTMTDFGALWKKLEQIVHQEKQKQKTSQETKCEAQESSPSSLSMMGKWLCSFISHNSFEQHVQTLRDQGKEIVTTLNMFLQALVRRVAALYVESTILRCGCCRVGRQVALLVRNFLGYSRASNESVKVESPRWRKRQFSEMRPEDEDHARVLPIFPIRCEDRDVAESSPKFRKIAEFTILPTSIRKVDFDQLPVTKSAIVSPYPFAIPKTTASAPMIAPRRRVFAEVDIRTI